MREGKNVRKERRKEHEKENRDGGCGKDEKKNNRGRKRRYRKVRMAGIGKE